jgi:small-conductance mechanosensitive channel
MINIFQIWDFNRFLSEMPHKFLVQVETPVFLIQCGVVLIAGGAAFWLGTLIRRPLAKFALKKLPKNWGPGFIRVCEHVAAPLFLLAMLWTAAIAGSLMQTALPIIEAAINLVLAWIFIRLLSFAVRSPFVSVALSVVAWSIAALNILGLFGPLIGYMKTVHVYDKDKEHFISLLDVTHAVVVLVLLLWLTRMLFFTLQRRITRANSLTPSLQVLLVQLLQIVLPAVAVIVALQTVGVDLTTLTVVFGALGLGVGLGLQRIVANLVAGMSLLIGKTIKPGDIIEYDKSYGWVTAMGARYVTLRTRDGIEHLIPNDHFLEHGVVNWSHSDIRLRLHVPVSIAYDSDVRQAIALCIEAAKSVKRVIDRPEPLCLLKGFGENSVDLEIRMWIEDPRNGTQNVKSEVLLAVWDRFKEAGIRFPFPQRDVHIVSLPPDGRP